MINCNAVVVIENNELSEILYFKFESVYTLKHNFSFKFLTCTENQLEDIILDISLDLCRKANLYCIRIDIVPYFPRRHHEAYFTDGCKPHLDVNIIFRHR